MSLHRLFYNAGDVALALRHLGPTGNKAEGIVKAAAELAMEMLDKGGTWCITKEPGVILVEEVTEVPCTHGYLQPHLVHDGQACNERHDDGECPHLSECQGVTTGNE